MSRLQDLTGKVFNRVTVLGLFDRRKTKGGYGKIQWLCKCHCGQEFTAESQNLKKRTKGCGCQKGKPRLPGEVRWIRRYMKMYRGNAKQKDREFALTFSEFERLIKSNCYYCGKAPTALLNKEFSDFRVNGLDRVDNSQGYNLSNIVPCCKLCNRMKFSLSQNEFFEHLTNIVRRHF